MLLWVYVLKKVWFSEKKDKNKTTELNQKLFER